MKKEFFSRSQVIENNAYLEEEFVEYYGADCIGIWMYENEFDDEEVDVCVRKDGKFVYMNMGMEWVFSSLEEFETWYQNM